MPLSPGAQLALDRLLEDPDEILAIVLPHGMPAAERRRELNVHQAVVDELRAAGWTIDVQRRAADNGEIITLGLDADAPQPDPPS